MDDEKYGNYQFCSELDYDDIHDVRAAFPSAEAVEPLSGGWLAFFDSVNHNAWKDQR